MTHDILDRLAGYRPTAETISAEWSHADRAAMRSSLLDEPGRPVAFRARPRRRMHVVAPLAASAAVLVAIAIAAVVTIGSSHNRADVPALSGGEATHFATASLSDQPDIGSHKYAMRSMRPIAIKADGTTTDAPDQTPITNYVSTNGDAVSLRPDAAHCGIFPLTGSPSFQIADAAFIASLPTDAAKLRDYMLAHVSGSASTDEAVFVAVGDLLRESDLLTSPRLRAALVDVLSTSHVITVHLDDRDYLGRPAIRVDYTDQARRAGELDSLYFAPTTFQLLEERVGANGLPADAPSTLAYSATESRGPGTPATLSGAATVTVMTEEKAVDSLPSPLTGCVRYVGTGESVTQLGH